MRNSVRLMRGVIVALSSLLRFAFMGVGISVASWSGECAAQGRKPTVITEEGVAKAAIVKPSDASEVVDFAARELQRYVEKISGAKLPVRDTQAKVDGPAIVLGTAKLDKPKRGLECDSFRIKREGDQLRLTGNTNRAVLYSVYALLESLGVAWLEPGEAGEIVPQKRTIVVDNMNLTFRPAFDLRGTCIHNKGGSKETIDWMGKMRLNLAMYPPHGYKKRAILLMKGTSHNFAERTGLGPNWHNDPAHLEYVAMLNGRRTIRGSTPWDIANVEPCMSNPEVVQMLLTTSLKFIEDHPDIFLVDMRAADKMNVWCECEECRKHTPTDTYVKYINQLAARVHKKWPKKKVSLIAYFNTVFPPRHVRPGLSFGNMILWFCPISRPYRQPINSRIGEEKTSIEFPTNKARQPVRDGRWEPILRAWRSAFDGPILVLDYYHWSGCAGGTRPGYLLFPRPDVFADDLRYYKELGLSGSIGVEPCPRHFPNGLNQYLKAKLCGTPYRMLVSWNGDTSNSSMAVMLARPASV